MPKILDHTISTNESQDKFRILFEQSSDAHIIFSDGGIIDCNQATLELLKVKSKSDVLKLHPAALSPEFQPDGQNSLEKSKQMDAIAMEKGVHRFEWVHKKSDGEEFYAQVTLNAVELDGKPSMIAVWHDLTELKSKEEKLYLANKKYQKDLEAAAQIQKSLLPVSSPRITGFRATWHFQPSGTLGGDILNVFPLDEKHVGLYVLDVTGHGVAASLLSVAASHFLSPFSEASFVRSTKSANKFEFAQPSEVAEKLNRHFCSNPEVTQLFTLLYGVLNVESLEFCYVCAGHPLPLVVSCDGKTRQIPGSGFPIGVDQDFEYSQMCLKLQVCDRLYLYSDGLTEARNSDGEMFGEKRLIETLDQHRCLPISEGIGKLVSSVDNWCAPGAPDDDLSILACELTAACQKSK